LQDIKWMGTAQETRTIAQHERIQNTARVVSYLAGGFLAMIGIQYIVDGTSVESYYVQLAGTASLVPGMMISLFGWRIGKFSFRDKKTGLRENQQSPM
jgi:hypothetical protein